MRNLYLHYQIHSIDQFAKARAWAQALIDSGYLVHWPVTHEMKGFVDGQTVNARDYARDINAMQQADLVVICVDGDDLTGAEFELGFVLALKELGPRSPELYVCDLEGRNPHPLGDLYIGSRIKRNAAIGGVDTHAQRIESMSALTALLQERIATVVAV